MEKLWLSGTEKKFYQKVYSKLVESANKTQAKDLKKLAVTRAGINSDHSMIIIQKSFDQSSDKKHIDQTGFFYLMKYIAYLQNGGDPNDDITKIEKELPKPNLPSSSKANRVSTEGSQGINESSIDSVLQSSVEQKNDAEEEQKRIDEEPKIAYEEPKHVEEGQKKEDEQIKNIEEVADNVQKEEERKETVADVKENTKEGNIEMDKINDERANSDGQQQLEGSQKDDGDVQAEEKPDEKIEQIDEVQKEIDEQQEVIQNEKIEEINITTNEQNPIPEVVEEIEVKIVADDDQSHNIQAQDEGITIENSRIQEIQLVEGSNDKNNTKADEIDDKKENLQAQEEGEQSQSPKKEEQTQQISQLVEDCEIKKEQPQINLTIPQNAREQDFRLVTFGQDSASALEFQKLIQYAMEEIQKQQANAQDRDTNPQEKESKQDQSLSIVREQMSQENSKIEEGNNKANSKLMFGVSKHEGIDGADVSAIGDGISQLSFMDEGQSQFFNRINNSGETNNQLSNKLVLEKKQSSSKQPNGAQGGDKIEDILGNHFQNRSQISALDGFSSLELEQHIDQSVYETQQEKNNFPIKSQRQQSNNGSSAQMLGFNEDKNKGAHNKEDEDNDDKQLMKSVMECNEFSKVDQNQIKIALDMFKSNREDSYQHKNKAWREKPRKRVKIEGWREACDNLFMKKHVLYEIHTQSDKGQIFNVERRYNHFKALHNYFENSVDYYGIIKPQLPSSNKTNIGSYLGSTLMDQATLEQRKIDLENYLNLYLQNEILRQDKILCQFLEEKEFIAPEEKPFSYLEWMKNLAANAYNTDFAELKEYVEAVLKTNMQEFFQQSENEIDTREIDEKMEKINAMGESVSRLVMFMSEDIRFDTEQRLSVDELEDKFYTEADQRADEQTQLENKSGIQDSLKKFKAELIDFKDQIKQRVDSKVQVLQQFKFIQSLIESAKVAQQVLKRKITDRIILKKIKTSKYNKLHEQNNNKSDASEAQRKLKTVSDQFKLSEQIIISIQNKLTSELGSFISIQQTNIAEALASFVAMQKQSLMIAARVDASAFKLFS